MRPPRIFILVLFFVACLFLLCRSIAAVARSPVITTPASSPPKSGLKSLFSFSAPFSLFPPNAIITIADDNSTSFAARPAAFGPPLPIKGLNGQLWIGSGFTEEALQDGEDSDGELGCSDVPGYDGSSSTNTPLRGSAKKVEDSPGSKASPGKAKNQKRDENPKGPVVDRTSTSSADAKPKAVDDGTDDYLHERLRSSPSSQNEAGLSSAGHADIQSIQEGAEIAGKIVLLSRGGCGFLEKVKWAQRRGAIALIVGDNQRGGPLIQMYARGDTSNVSIPSIFTSRTTAYLLSSLMQPGSFIEDIIDENGKPSYQVQHPDKSRRNKKAKLQTTTTIETPKATNVNKPKTPATKKAVGGAKARDPAPKDAKSQGWLARIFSWGSSSNVGDRSRPPSSGRLDWVLVEDFSDSQDKIIKDSLDQASKSNTKSNSKPKSDKPSSDEFKIGVHDWRDPDLVGAADQKDGSQAPTKSGEKTPESKSKPDTGKADPKKSKDPNGPKGGSITPGSGEYFPNDRAKGKMPSNSKSDKLTPESGLLSKLFGDQEEAGVAQAKPPAPAIHTPIVEEPAPGNGDAPPEREGLWVVITPSSGASPFFDTLLVLVISPLITLTVVYALLILRARIRRRRWRAPKSVVERLPVRTYHTVATTPSQSPRFPRSPSPSPPSPTTPLLQSQHSSSRSRPRSRTTTGVAGDLLQVNQSLQVPKSPPHEKPSEWKKYMGRQVECVVCLEEYVDGVSQVMSLPCGHEFHVECM